MGRSAHYGVYGIIDHWNFPYIHLFCWSIFLLIFKLYIHGNVQ